MSAWRISWELPGGHPFGFVEVCEAETIEDVIEFFDSGISGVPADAVITAIQAIPC